MVPSSASISDPNVVLNTIVAESLLNIAIRLEKAKNFNDEVNNLLIDIINKHSKILFNGDGYSNDWEKEAEKRGLLNIKSTVEAIPALIMDKSIALFEKHNVLSKVELYSRYEVLLEAYIKQVNIEAQTMIELSKREIIPCALKYVNEIAVSYNNLKATGIDLDLSTQENILSEVTSLIGYFRKNLIYLESVLEKAQNLEESIDQAKFYREKVFPQMGNLRYYGDELEKNIDTLLWPMPTYGQLLFSV
jgi:glutamine synthetase